METAKREKEKCYSICVNYIQTEIKSKTKNISHEYVETIGIEDNKNFIRSRTLRMNSRAK